MEYIFSKLVNFYNHENITCLVITIKGIILTHHHNTINHGTILSRATQLKERLYVKKSQFVLYKINHGHGT